MVDEKNWYESRTIWGALVAILASLMGGFGFEFNQEIQNDLAETIIQLVAAFGALIALYGRLNATRIIG